MKARVAPSAASLVLAAAAVVTPWPAQAEDQCSGHQFLDPPRTEGSCPDVKPELFASSDGALQAVVLPVDVSLYATPDMESRVEIRSQGGDTFLASDHASPRGQNGHYVYAAKWSPDSEFFVFSLTSSGGHQPWSFPILVYSSKRNVIASFSDMIDGLPTLLGSFDLAAPHSLTAATWKEQGAFDDPVPVTVDLEAVFEKLPPPTP
jgi:hypothetical protein